MPSTPRRARLERIDCQRLPGSRRSTRTCTATDSAGLHDRRHARLMRSTGLRVDARVRGGRGREGRNYTRVVLGGGGAVAGDEVGGGVGVPSLELEQDAGVNVGRGADAGVAEEFLDLFEVRAAGA